LLQKNGLHSGRKIVLFYYQFKTYGGAMKKVILIISVLMLLFPGCSKKIYGDLKYSYKSGIVTYSVNNQYTQIYYFDDYGKKEAFISIGSNGKECLPRVINTDGYVIEYGAVSKKGVRRKSTGSVIAPMGIPVFSQSDAKANLDYKELGDDIILGKNVKGYSCRIYKPDGFLPDDRTLKGSENTYYDIWLYENIPLFIKVSFTDIPRSDPRIIEATKLELDVPIPNDIINVPADVILIGPQ
jgi:hypothetical protein